MKRQLVVLIIINLLQQATSAQTLNVLSCYKDTIDMICTDSPRFDLNDVPCAVIKIKSYNFENNLSFNGNIVGDIIHKDSLYYIYVASGTKRLQVYCNDYMPKTIDFIQYTDTQIGVSGNYCYQVNLCVDNDTDSLNKISGSRVLSFSSKQHIARLFVNGKEWNVVNNSAKHLLPYGKYTYDAVSENYLNDIKEIQLAPGIGSMLVNIEFKKQ